MDEKIHVLINRLVDGVITHKEREELERYIREHPEIQAEIQEIKKLKEVMDMFKPVDPDRAWEDYWKSLYNRLERGIAWIFISIGAIIVLTYGAIEWVKSLIKEADLPLIVKMGLFGLVFGLVVLFVSVIRERIFISRVDKYSKEVKR